MAFPWPRVHADGLMRLTTSAYGISGSPGSKSCSARSSASYQTWRRSSSANSGLNHSGCSYRIAIGRSIASEHRVVVRSRLSHRLEHVPVLDHLALLEPEDVRRRGATIVRRRPDQAVRHHEIALSDHAFDVDVQLWKLA